MKIGATKSLKKFATLGLTLLSVQVYASAPEKITSLDQVRVRVIGGAIYSSCDVKRVAECKSSKEAAVTNDLITYTANAKIRLQGIPSTRKGYVAQVKKIDSMLESVNVANFSDALLEERNAYQNAIFDLDKSVVGENYFLTGAIVAKPKTAGDRFANFSNVEHLGYRDIIYKEGESIRIVYTPQMKMNFVIERYLNKVARGEGTLLERILVKCEQREMVNSYGVASLKVSIPTTPELECTTSGNGRLRFAVDSK